MPEEVTFVSDSEGICSTDSGTPEILTCDFDSVDANSSESTDITVTVDVDTPSGTITNDASVVSDNDQNDANDEATEDTRVLGQADLAISKSSPSFANSGQILVYTIIVNNLGPNDAENVQVSDTLPSEATFDFTEGCDNDPGGVPTCDLGTILSGDNKSFEITVNLDSEITPGTIITNAASASSDNPDPENENNTADTDTTILPKSIVTSSSLEVEGFEEFRLIYTNDPEDIGTFKVTASNPGQTYYNIFAVGEEGDKVTLEITIPRPYITKGANPIHAYSDVDTITGFYEPSDEVPFEILNPEDLTETPSGAYGISLDDYPNGFVTIIVEGEIPETGLFYLNIHLDYGLKKTLGYINADGDAVSADERIDDDTDYDFTVSCNVEGTITDGDDMVTNDNDFRKFRGIVVLVVDNVDTGIPGQNIFLKEGTDELGSGMTDANGLVFIEFKHKGKAASYDVVWENAPETTPIQLSGKMPYAFVEFMSP